MASFVIKSKQSGFRTLRRCVQMCSVKKVRKKETLAQVFSCGFCENSKNTFFIEHLWWLLLFLILQNLSDTEDSSIGVVFFAKS